MWRGKQPFKFIQVRTPHRQDYSVGTYSVNSLILEYLCNHWSDWCSVFVVRWKRCEDWMYSFREICLEVSSHQWCAIPIPELELESDFKESELNWSQKNATWRWHRAHPQISRCDKYIDRQMDHLVKALPCNGLTNKKIKCLWLYHDHVMLLTLVQRYELKMSPNIT